MTFRRSRLMPFLLLGLSLAGQRPVQFGGALSLDVPLEGLKTDLNDKVGLGTSFQVTFGGGERLAVRPRLDLEIFRVASYHRFHSDYREARTFFSAGLGADLLYAFGADARKGLYGLAGAGVLQWFQYFENSYRWDAYGSESRRSHTRENRVSPWVALGLGYQITRNVGVETRAVLSQYDGPTAGGLASFSWETPTEVRRALIAQVAVTGRW
ncbi:hypothetical protein [Mesoterricola silvestris]|uniref:Outer membrane protein beta-barrel domain-containing protein n=1 Tax=Mesoterricola silvestris TaxID=2927979 RepID=A0AA48GRJ4_9BACT|nr:hypothetical protein [Mesoterricola silvestris]BDU72707.1 hypothetical protein METEAL_18810 [Mesoterricola silvestris]